MPWWAYPAACCVLVGMVGGWVLGYAHRSLIELGREYGRLRADGDRLADAFIESAPWITAGATPSQRADLCAVSVATEEAARHL
jgi:hypothetical protein